MFSKIYSVGSLLRIKFFYQDHLKTCKTFALLYLTYTYDTLLYVSGIVTKKIAHVTGADRAGFLDLRTPKSV
jgi:hypothetical protein